MNGEVTGEKIKHNDRIRIKQDPRLEVEEMDLLEWLFHRGKSGGFILHNDVEHAQRLLDLGLVERVG